MLKSINSTKSWFYYTHNFSPTLDINRNIGNTWDSAKPYDKLRQMKGSFQK